MLRRKMLLIGLGVLLLLAVGAGVAAGGGTVDETAPVHCVVRIEPLQAGEVASEVSEPVCFDSYSDALSAATGGAFASPAPQSSTVIGQDYSRSGFSGSTLTWVTSNPNGCFDGSIYAASSMPSGWANVVSSARSYQGCAQYYHYDYTNYGGAVLDCGYSCSNMGAMDNQTESERWCQSCGP